MNQQGAGGMAGKSQRPPPPGGAPPVGNGMFGQMPPGAYQAGADAAMASMPQQVMADKAKAQAMNQALQAQGGGKSQPPPQPGAAPPLGQGPMPMGQAQPMPMPMPQAQPMGPQQSPPNMAQQQAMQAAQRPQPPKLALPQPPRQKAMPVKQKAMVQQLRGQPMQQSMPWDSSGA
jgi:hypothetical protein